MSRNRLILGALPLLVAACQQATNQVPTRSLDRPTDVALLCVSDPLDYTRIGEASYGEITAGHHLHSRAKTQVSLNTFTGLTRTDILRRKRFELAIPDMQRAGA